MVVKVVYPSSIANGCGRTYPFNDERSRLLAGIPVHPLEPVPGELLFRDTARISQKLSRAQTHG